MYHCESPKEGRAIINNNITITFNINDIINKKFDIINNINNDLYNLKIKLFFIKNNLHNLLVNYSDILLNKINDQFIELINNKNNYMIIIKFGNKQIEAFEDININKQINIVTITYGSNKYEIILLYNYDEIHNNNIPLKIKEQIIKNISIIHKIICVINKNIMKLYKLNFIDI